MQKKTCQLHFCAHSCAHHIEFPCLIRPKYQSKNYDYLSATKVQSKLRIMIQYYRFTQFDRSLQCALQQSNELDIYEYFQVQIYMSIKISKDVCRINSLYLFSSIVSIILVYRPIFSRNRICGSNNTQEHKTTLYTLGILSQLLQ